jgi:Transposase DDE domain group 1
MENRLKELHHGLAMDRTSCHWFLANQFRVLLTVAAYILFQTLQAQAEGTACADAQVSTLRERLIKLAAWVERSVRRIVLHFPHHRPLADDLATDRAPRRRGARVSPRTCSRRLIPGRGVSPRSSERVS